MNKLKVLVVDDEPDIRLELQDFIQELDFECVLASNGEEALSLFKADESIHIVLSDLTMPGMTGLQLLEPKLRRARGGCALQFQCSGPTPRTFP